MDSNQQQNPKTRDKDTGKLEEQQEQAAKPSSSPPSASSSPSHEFSFTISLHSVPDNKNRASSPVPPPHHHHHPSSIAIDLSPADDIFFHGHLLPLHLLSHLPAVSSAISPRSSTNSIDSFTLPIRELIDDHDHHHPIRPNTHFCSNQEQSINGESETEQRQRRRRRRSNKSKNNNKSFSLFSRWRKGCEAKDSDDKEMKQTKSNNNKLRLDLSNVIKRYVRMVRPLLFFGKRSSAKEEIKFHQQPPYSFSGNLSSMRSNKEEFGGRRGGGMFSAPASMRTSPTNSGLLLETATATATTLPSPTSSSDSTMEELQAAIQAAIAHCKNSIAVEEKLKCQD